MNLRDKFDELGTEINSTKLCIFFQNIKMNMTLQECEMIIEQYGSEQKICFEQIKKLFKHCNAVSICGRSQQSINK